MTIQDGIVQTGGLGTGLHGLLDGDGEAVAAMSGSAQENHVRAGTVINRTISHITHLSTLHRITM
jgi:hypothetical protein